MLNKYGLIAKLVWDGGDTVLIPEEMGAPAPNQMQGLVGERLTELGGRSCYDSLGKGRASPDYHKHILEVGHFSVCEHFHITVQTAHMFDLWTLMNRPGIWVRMDAGMLRITFNPRVILDWDQWSRENDVLDLVGMKGALGNLLSYHMEKACPMIVTPRERDAVWASDYDKWSAIVPPKHHEEKWISFFMGASRGWSHEQVRHRFRTAVSQRSTRFVDEDGSPWVDHPLIQEFWASTDPLPDDPDNRLRGALKALTDDTKQIARETYAKTSSCLQKWLLNKGIDKLTARKQARGAARGYLGNALWTEMIYSASAAQWKRMLRLRCNPAADAEIRVISAEVLPGLKASRYGDEFSAFELVPASDGLGSVAVEKKN